MIEAIATVAAVTAIAALALTAIRLKRARAEFEAEVGAWKTRLDRDQKLATKQRNHLLDALAETILLVDSNGSILFANQSAQNLFSGRELVGRRITDTLLDHRLLAVLQHCLQTNEPAIRQIVLPRHASPLGDRELRGTNAWVVDAAPVVDSPDDNPTTRVVIRDVTSEHQADQVRKDFVANASHELRTPLAIINGYLENLLDDGLVEDPVLTTRFLKVMRKHSERIARIVEDMLVISRLESGEAAALKVKPFRVRACISDVLERLEAMIQNQSAVIHIKVPEDDVSLDGDRFYWTQILFNLVENALKQNPRKGLEVTIGCTRDRGKLAIWVADNGVGIPSADLAHIFRRFYRVEKHHSQEEIKGTGLGLSIVKRAVEAHGGTIRVSSTPGEETKFLIELDSKAEARLAEEAASNGANSEI